MYHDAAAHLEMLGEGDWAVSMHCGGDARCGSQRFSGCSTRALRETDCSAPVCHLELLFLVDVDEVDDL
jgi:hypothetical protein